VMKAGRFFIWGNGLYGCLGHNNLCDVELGLKQVKHGRFAELFIVCAATGYSCLAAIDSSRLVPFFYFSTFLDIMTL
jgi:hypothetical protein